MSISLSGDYRFSGVVMEVLTPVFTDSGPTALQF